MSDRLEDLRKRHGKPWAYHDQEWALAEIDRLRANQIPGRCGECAHLIHTDTDPGYCEVAQSWWGKSEFCNRFEPKGE